MTLNGRKKWFLIVPLCIASVPFIIALGVHFMPAKTHDEKAVVWVGQFNSDNLAKFRSELQKRPEITAVEFRDSPGGKVMVADEVQRLIISRNLNTYARGQCLSACADTFLRGRTHTLLPSRFGSPTFLALHPMHAMGERNSGGTDIENRKIVANSGGKIPLVLLDRMYDAIDLKRGGIYIFPSEQKTSRGKGHVLFCRGNEKKLFADCEPISGYTPASLGISVIK